MTTLSEHKQKASAVLESLASGDPTAIQSNVSPDTYIQHNLDFPSGRQTLLDALPMLKESGTRVTVRRAIADGDLVALHSEYDLFGPKIGFDVFRFADGLIVEHWDNLQELPSAPNPSGHTMIDGPTQIADLAQTDANKTLVRAFIDDILVNGRMDRLAGYFAGDHYIQHNPQIGDGLSGLGAALDAMAQQGITMKPHPSGARRGQFRPSHQRGQLRRSAQRVLRPLPGRQRQDRGALGHHRGDSRSGSVEKHERQILRSSQMTTPTPVFVGHQHGVR